MEEKGKNVIKKVKNRLKKQEVGRMEVNKIDELSEELAILVKRVERIKSEHGIDIELSPYISAMIKSENLLIA